MLADKPKLIYVKYRLLDTNFVIIFLVQTLKQFNMSRQGREVEYNKLSRVWFISEILVLIIDNIQSECLF